MRSRTASQHWKNIRKLLVAQTNLPNERIEGKMPSCFGRNGIWVQHKGDSGDISNDASINESLTRLAKNSTVASERRCRAAERRFLFFGLLLSHHHHLPDNLADQNQIQQVRKRCAKYDACMLKSPD